MNESFTQRKIIQRYTAEGWLCIKLIQTNMNGIHDLICLRDGVAVFIEVKRQGGRIAPLQIYRHDQIKELGFDSYVTDDPEFYHLKK